MLPSGGTVPPLVLISFRENTINGLRVSGMNQSCQVISKSARWQLMLGHKPWIMTSGSGTSQNKLSHKLVCQAVIEWLVATNPIAPLCHLSLDRKSMLTCTVDLDGNYRAMPCIFTVQWFVSLVIDFPSNARWEGGTSGFSQLYEWQAVGSATNLS